MCASVVFAKIRQVSRTVFEAKPDRQPWWQWFWTKTRERVSGADAINLSHPNPEQAREHAHSEFGRNALQCTLASVCRYYSPDAGNDSSSQRFNQTHRPIYIHEYVYDANNIFCLFNNNGQRSL